MTLIGETQFTALDFESAGASRGATDEPVQIGWGGMTGAEIDAASFFTSYLRTEAKITWAAQKVHGITTAHLAGAPSLLELWPQVRPALQGRVVVAHGSGTEKRFLRAFPFHGFGPWVDTLHIARAAWPGRSDYSLGTLIGDLGLKPALDELCPGLPWHHALYDAVACLVLLRHLIHDAGLASEPLDLFLHPDASAHYRSRRT